MKNDFLDIVKITYFTPENAKFYRTPGGFAGLNAFLPKVGADDLKEQEDGECIWQDLGRVFFHRAFPYELPDEFIEKVRAAVKRVSPEKFLLGEVWEDATTKFGFDKRRTYLLGKGLDSVMNYPFKNAVLGFVCGRDAGQTMTDILSICEHYPAPALHVLMNFMSTHDTVRAITAIAGESCEGRNRSWQRARRLTPEQYENGRRLMTLAYAMIFTLPGIPSIYYGDEIGMQGYKDPFNRAFFDWESRETRIRPVLQNLAALRKSCPAFADGTLAVTQAQGGVLCYERRAEAAVAAVCINRTEQQVRTVLLGRTVEVQPCSFAVVTDPE